MAGWEADHESALSDGRPSREAPVFRYLLYDWDAARAALARSAANACGAGVNAWERLDTPDETRADACIALVAVDVPNGPVPLTLIRELRRARVRVIAYGGVRAWPLARRCEVLLAGASAVLDTEDRAFLEELSGHIRRLLSEEEQRARSDAEAREGLRALGMVGESPAMLAVYRTLVRACPLSDLPVLILGETGTGKELIARAVHRLDPARRTGPMRVLNCAAISPELAESELFGHRRGAFTGAAENRKGLFRAADGGLLFLDEIGELSLSLQAKLLRVLESGRVLSVGEDNECAVSVRVLAATNRDLPSMVAAGTFRQDLFHRLNVVSIRLPALRDRPEDLLPLIRHFVARYAGLSAHASPGIEPEFLDALRQAPLPGNVRQLENLVRWAIIHKEDAGPLALADLPPDLWQQLNSEPPRPGAARETSVSESLEAARPAAEPLPDASEIDFFRRLYVRFDGNLGRCLDHCERLLLEAGLHEAGGNQTRAAQRMGVTPRSVYTKLRKHGMAAFTRARGA